MKLKKIDVGEAVRFLEEGGEVAESFKRSIEAGGLIVEDVKKVAAAAAGIVSCGLTRHALCVLIQDRMPNQRNGRPYPETVINDVLEALVHIDLHVVKAVAKP